MAVRQVPILLAEGDMQSTLFAVASLCASAGSQPAQPITISPSVAQMVLVDAFVTDKKGRPIANLRQDDFALLEDDRPVGIAAFEPPAGVVAISGSEPGAPTGTAKPTPSGREPEHLTLVIYVDRWLLSPSGRKRALDQAATLAESHLAQGASVLVIADERGLRPLTPLTKDPAVVRAALTRIQGWATSAPGATDARNTVENIKAIIEAGDCDCVCLLPQLVSVIRTYAFSRVIEAQKVSDQLTFLVNALLGVSGRKALIYVSEGLEQRPGIHIYDQLTKICPAALDKDASAILAPMQEFETSAPLREVVARANAARVTFYPMDARGLTTYSSSDISQTDRTYVPSARSDMIRDANFNNPLQLLGEETGGFAMLRGLDPKTAMKRFDADEAGHYRIGFVPGDADGKIHTLRLRLNEKAQSKHQAEIRHRQAYLRAELPARRGQRALSALVFGLEENALRALVRVERTSETNARVHVSVPLSALTPLAGTDGKDARVQVVVSFRATGSEKAPVTVREKDVIVSLAPETLGRAGGWREIVVEVPVGEGDYEFAVGVEDIASGSAAYVRRAVPAIPRALTR